MSFAPKLLAEKENREENLKGMFLDNIVSIKKDGEKYTLDVNTTTHIKEDQTHNSAVNHLIGIHKSKPKKIIDGD